MVKQLDENDALLVDHIGVDLWGAAVAWRDRLHAEMVEAGHGWYGDARGAIAAHLHPQGLSQSTLVARMGMTKQAVQQLVDGLEAEGVVRREPDPNDGRGKRVVYTPKGLAALRDAVKIKRKMERALREQLGDDAFEALRSALTKVAESVERRR